MEEFKILYDNLVALNEKSKSDESEKLLELLKGWNDSDDKNLFIQNQVISFMTFISEKKNPEEFYKSTRPEIKAILDYVMAVQEAIQEQPEDPDLKCKPPLSTRDLGFNDIAGQDTVKDNLKMQYIYPFTFTKLFPIKTKGILLYGVGGTGKTMLAKAATSEIGDAAFFAPSAGALRGKYEGDTEKNISNVFDCAKKELLKNPNYNMSIIFFDEFDSIAGQRGEDPSMSRSVNTLLQEMDGINTFNNVSVMAATNNPSSIDPAIMRRFTTRIFVDLPDENARQYLVRIALAKVYTAYAWSRSRKAISNNIWNYSENTYNPNASFLGMIEKYSKPEYTKEVTGYLSTQTKLVKKIVDNDYINEIVEKLGPTEVGKKIINNPKAYNNDSEELNSEEHIFGYSPSDITNVIEMAIRFSSNRSLGGYYKKIIRGNKEYYLVDVLEEYKNNLVSSLETSEEKSRVISYDIRPSDIELAIKSYASTVDNRLYFELLTYSMYN